MRTNTHLLERIDSLKDELNKKGRIVASIYKISRLLNRPANRDKILRSILQECQKLFNFTRCVILLINKTEDKLEAKYCLGYSLLEEKRAFEHPLDMKTQLCRETIAAKEGRIIYIQDIENDQSLTEFDRKMEKFWKRVSTIAVPLKINREIIGVIEGDRKEKMILSKSDINLLASFANQASVILEIARLYNQILTERNIAENILESAPDGILAIDQYKKIDSINRKAEEIIRKKRHEVLGKPISEVLRKDIVDLLNDSIDNQKPSQYMEVTNTRRSGKKNTYGLSSSIMKKNFPHEGAGAILTIHDLTEIKQTEAMLRRVDNLSSLGRMSASIAHEIRNPLASINFNVQILSKKILDDMQRISNKVLTDIDRINMIIKRTLDFSRNSSPDMVYDYINGLVEESLGLMKQQLKNQEIKIVKDMQSDAPRLLFEPHQIRNALEDILLSASSVQALSKKSLADMQRISNNILEGIERINMIIRRTLDFSRNSLPSMAFGDINDTVKESIALIHQQLKSQKIEIHQHLYKEGPKLLFDPHQLRNALVNILLNAAEAMPKGGVITIRSRVTEARGRKQLILLVKDSGMGIPPEHLRQIFDPFFTTKQEGTGLGLSIAHKILEQHKVIIDVRSTVNKGTTFYMKFPLQEIGIEHVTK